MSPVHVLLDRELVVSGLVHDLRGALTVAKFSLELGDAAPDPRLSSAIGRMEEIASLFAQPVAEPTRADFRGTPVRVTGPIEVLELALGQLSHREVVLSVSDGRVSVRIVGVSARERKLGWSHGDVREWLANGGLGLAYARLRIAVRIVGAQGFAFDPPSGASEGDASFWLPHG